MAVAGDCDGTPECEADTDGHFLTGDSATGTYAFTACDLKRDHTKGHSVDVPTDTYQGCEFHQAAWATFSGAPTGYMYPRGVAMMGDNIVFVGPVRSTSNAAATPDDWGTDDARVGSNDFEMRGPYTAADPTGASATSLHLDLKSYYASGRSWSQFEGGLIKLDKDGTPVKMMHYGGHGVDHPKNIAGTSDGSKAAMAGLFQGNITFGTTTLDVQHGNADGTSSDSYSGAAQDGYVAVVDSNLDAIWAKSWPLMATSTGSYAMANGVGFDASGSNLFASGFQCSPECNGTIAKFAAADGATQWEKTFSDVDHWNGLVVDPSGDIYVAGRMGQSAGAKGTGLGAACASTTCSVLARLNGADGSTKWARTVEGGSPGYAMYMMPGKVKFLEAANSEPYVYVTLNSAAEGVGSVVSLDSGTPYAGCKNDATGVVTPAYDVSMTAEVTSCSAGSTYVTGADGVAASSAHTNVHCDAHTSKSCVAKYHALTGKPMWSTTLPSPTDVMPFADGTVHVVGYGTSQFTFDTVKTSKGAAGQVFHAVLSDTDGKGISATSYGGSSVTRVYAATGTPDGDVVVAGYTGSQTFKFGEAFTATVPDKAVDGVSPVIIFKVSTSASGVRPSCVDASCAATAGNCYIDGACAANGATSELFPCLMCDTAQDTSAWVDVPGVGVTDCYIDGVCYKGADGDTEADKASYSSRYSPQVAYSDCRYCDPPKDKYAWSVKDGYSVIEGQRPPNDCALADETPTDPGSDATDSTTAGGGGTVQESNGAASLVCGVGAAAAAAVLL